MTDVRSILRICFLAVGYVVAPTIGQAEFVAELYGGGSFTSNADVEVTSNLGGPSIALQGVNFNTSWTAGGRFGYWFKEVGGLGAFGMGLDVFAFQPEADRQTVQLSIGGTDLGPFQMGSIKMSTVAIAFEVLRFRLHLAKSDELPQGRVQPYLSVGPALFITETSTENVFPANQSSTKASLGVKAGAGVNVHITPTWSLFADYRFTHFASEATFHTAPPLASSENRIKTDLNTHHVVGGVGFHF